MTSDAVAGLDGRERVVSGSTQLAAVIGSPVRHSLSPVLHNAAFAALGLDWVYVAFDVAPGHAAGALSAMRELGIAGLSVTMPHKEAVADGVDVCTEAARALRAVNCVVARGGVLEGHNTDGAGFVDALADELGFTVAGRPAVVLGAGGAARAVVKALADAGAADVAVVNRSATPAEVAARLAGERGRVGTAADVTGADLVVNATPIGMTGGGAADQRYPIDPELLRAGQVAADLVYQPLETAFVHAARARGAAAVGGLGMLVHQAAHAFTLWTGEPAPLGAMREAVQRHLAARQRT